MIYGKIGNYIVELSKISLNKEHFTMLSKEYKGPIFAGIEKVKDIPEEKFEIIKTITISFKEVDEIDGFERFDFIDIWDDKKGEGKKFEILFVNHYEKTIEISKKDSIDCLKFMYELTQDEK